MKNRIESGNLVQVFQKAHGAALRETTQLERMLTNLRFEGKSARGRNLKQIQEVVRFLKSELAPHMEMEERSLFPFLRSHVPKLEPVIHLLYSEHKDFKQSLVSFEAALRELSHVENHGTKGKLLELIRKSGIYIVYLLRHHIQAEEENLYKAINDELRVNEKRELQKLTSQELVSLRVEG